MRRAVKNLFSNADSDIARFKADFALLRTNFDTANILSVSELTVLGLSEIKFDLDKVAKDIELVHQGVKSVHHTGG